MNRLVQAAVVTAEVGLSLVAPASAQMIVRFDAPPPPIPASLARDLRRLGVALPRDRVRGVVQVRQSARDGRIEVRFGEAGSAPKPRQAARNALREPVAASAKPPLPAPRKAAPDVQARPETAASQESSA